MDLSKEELKPGPRFLVLTDLLLTFGTCACISVVLDALTLLNSGVFPQVLTSQIEQRILPPRVGAQDMTIIPGGAAFTWVAQDVRYYFRIRIHIVKNVTPMCISKVKYRLYRTFEFGINCG